jgi:hypothetical protein
VEQFLIDLLLIAELAGVLFVIEYLYRKGKSE